MRSSIKIEIAFISVYLCKTVELYIKCDWILFGSPKFLFGCRQARNNPDLFYSQACFGINKGCQVSETKISLAIFYEKNPYFIGQETLCGLMFSLNSTLIVVM